MNGRLHLDESFSRTAEKREHWMKSPSVWILGCSLQTPNPAGRIIGDLVRATKQ